MKLIIQVFTFIFVLISFIYAKANNSDQSDLAVLLKNDKIYQSITTKYATASDAYDSCLETKSTDECKALKTKRDELEKKEIKRINLLHGRTSEDSECSDAYNAFNADRKKALDKCNDGGLTNLVQCMKQDEVCDKSESESENTIRTSNHNRRNRSKKACLTTVLYSLNENKEAYEKLVDEYKDSESAVERQQNNVNDLNQEIINKENQLSDAKLNAEQVIRDSAKENARLGQEAVQQSLTLQLQIDQAKFEIEDLISLKATELAKAKNAVEDAKLDCYEIAVKQYNDEQNACLIRKRRRISEGKYSTNSLRGLFTGSRPGSCKKNSKERDMWRDKYQLDCTENTIHKAKVERIKQQYSETAKKLNTTIKRKAEGIDRLVTQLQTYEKNHQQMNQQLLAEQKATLQRATEQVGRINKELLLLQQKRFQAESALRNEQSIQSDINRNKMNVNANVMKNKELSNQYAGSKKIERAEALNTAFGYLANVSDSLINANQICCNPEKKHTKCSSVERIGKSLKIELDGSSSSPGSRSN